MIMRKIDQMLERLETKIDGLGSHMNKRFDVLNRRTLALESSMRDMRAIIDRNATEERPQALTIVRDCNGEEASTESVMNVNDLYEGIPPAYHIPLESLRYYETNKTSRGNFAVKLVEVLFPELFGPDNMYKCYSYNGGKRYNKLELDPIRKMAIRKYVMFFYPELNKPELYQKAIIDPVNERLRRKDADKRREYEERRRLKSAVSNNTKESQPLTSSPPPPSVFEELPSDLHLSQIEGDLFGDLSASRNILHNAFAEL